MARDFERDNADRIDGGDNFGVSTNAAIAFACWANAETLPGQMGLISKGYNGSTTAWQLYITDTLVVAGTYNGSIVGANGNHGISAGAWHHYYGDYDGSSWNVYVDGSLINTTTIATGPQSNGANFAIGNIYSNGSWTGNAFDGLIAEVGVWINALSADEITALAKGYAPSHFRRGLYCYAPLIGRASPELELKSGVSLSVTGAVVADHPRIIYPKRKK